MKIDEISITSQDIIDANNILEIPEKFDDQRRIVIKSMESRDIVACPGSGKTTALLAKLIILSRKMPFKNNKGICVLTHTNVAIDEVKEKLGDKASELLSYPNFIGTIQSFVDKYLAIPASYKYYGRKPSVIDTHKFNAQFEKTFNNIFRGWGKGFKAFCERNRVSISDLRLSIDDNNLYKGNKVFIFKNDSDKKYEKKLKVVFNTLIKSGIFRFEMAIELAFKYISEYENELKPLLTERFRFVFVDEMQDTNSIQMDILSKAFDTDNTVFQCFGDPKQAIYDSLFGEEANWIPHNPLFITSSKRFNSKIAKVTDCIALDPYKMVGTDAMKNLHPPIIITYKDNDVSKVLEIFARIIMHYNLQKDEKSIFKAVGMVKGKDKLGIKDYYLSFDKINNKKNSNTDYPHLHMYLTKISRDVLVKAGAKAYYSRFINAILKVLRLSEIKTRDGSFFSKTSFLKYMNENDERLFNKVHILFARFIMLIENEKDILKPFKQLMVIILKRLFNINITSIILEFLDDNIISVEPTVHQSQLLAGNNFEFDNVQIEIDTVHGVKGQTHTATLYL